MRERSAAVAANPRVVSIWTARDIPPQHGRSAVVTGTGGLGFETAIALAEAGAEVIVAGRDAVKGAAAVAQIARRVRDANVRFAVLDLANLASIEAFASDLRNGREHLDVLVNNAGVMNPPRRQTTADGFELQFGTNFLGHFALTAALLPLLRRGPASRVVSLSSIAARSGGIDFDDLQSERAYDPMKAYAQSKLACLMFSIEFQRRSDAEGYGITSLAAHPGLARTNLFDRGGIADPLFLMRAFLGPVAFQSARQGALPTLYAATATTARAGGYYGPSLFDEIAGWPAPARVPVLAADPLGGKLLWNAAERLTREYPSVRGA